MDQAAEPIDQTQSSTPSKDTNLAQQLSSVRERAMKQLVPLIDELDETPERKFDICIAAVRSTSQPDLLEKALGFAENIEDKSEKAQALIDIANEATVRLG
jgi:hypothetical protein